MARPLAALDLTIVTMIHGVLNVKGGTLDSIWAVGFFVVSPGGSGRALARPYGNHQAAAATRDGHSGDAQLQFSGISDPLFERHLLFDHTPRVSCIRGTVNLINLSELREQPTLRSTDLLSRVSGSKQSNYSAMAMLRPNAASQNFRFSWFQRLASSRKGL